MRVSVSDTCSPGLLSRRVSGPCGQPHL